MELDYNSKNIKMRLPMAKLTNTEIDIQIAATVLYDYFRDLLILSGNVVVFDERYQATRIQFGEYVVQLVRAIKEDIKKK